MIRSFKYRLHPNAAQELELERWRMQCCALYNAALEQRITAWKQKRIHVSKYNQQADLTDLREDSDWWSVSVWAQRSALYRLDDAFQAFFRRCKSGGKPGYPRFKPAERYNSFSIGRVKLTKNRVHVPKLGHVKLALYRPLQGEIRDVTIRKDGAGKWWVGFACEVGDAPTKIAVSSSVGIDLGLTSFATLSNGEHVPNPRYLRKSEDALAQRQQAMERTQRGSKSRERARILAAKINQRIHNQRIDHARKLACNLFKRFDLVAYEDLDVKLLAQHPTLAKSIHDASWTTFIRCLTLKAENAGRWAVPVDPCGTTQRCSGCEAMVPKQLGDRWHDCPHCGLSLNRDHNAARNVLRLGQSRIDSRESSEVAFDQGRSPSCCLGAQHADPSSSYN